MLTGGVAKWNLEYETVDKPRTFSTLRDEELLLNRTGASTFAPGHGRSPRGSGAPTYRAAGFRIDARMRQIWSNCDENTTAR